MILGIAPNLTPRTQVKNNKHTAFSATLHLDKALPILESEAASLTRYAGTICGSDVFRVVKEGSIIKLTHEPSTAIKGKPTTQEYNRSVSPEEIFSWMFRIANPQ